MSSSGNSNNTVRIKTICAPFLKDNYQRISVLFSALLNETKCGDGFSIFEVQCTTPLAPDRSYSSDFISRLQKYVDDICKEGCGVGGEDSSYDSDYEADTPGAAPAKHHQDVSRTTSDTLAAEYADYVQTDSNPGYTARVEFALKLGYTEKLVQAALQKLGPTPTQNELLRELIKLGAQRGTSSCDNSPTDTLITSSVEVESSSSQSEPSPSLRSVVIDGSNVAMSHGNKEIFSCRGIRICVDWFKARGHKDITVFVPTWRKESPRPDNPIQDREILAELEKERQLVFTPSRFVGGRRMVCYDDRYVLKLASEVDGIVVSNDNYRDLCQESTEFRRVIEERILMYSFVNDRFMPPDDPLGRSGPTLDNFLRTQPKKSEPPPLCPYGKKCTYGNKCKYNHPERGPLPHKSVTERLSEHAQRHLQAREGETRKLPLGRTRSHIPQHKEPQHTIVSKSRSVDNVGENLHRKLQRQLTLNPSADPRLANVRKQFKPAMPNWEMHQNVTRIVSAPDSNRPWPPQVPMRHMQRVSSCSDPQLNNWHQWQSNPQEDARRKLHYHLAAIFPEEQVSQVMQLYPEETNPQKICAAILAMFPKQ